MVQELDLDMDTERRRPDVVSTLHHILLFSGPLTGVCYQSTVVLQVSKRWFRAFKESGRALANVVNRSLTNHEEAKKQYETLFLFALQMSRPYPRN